MNTAPNELHSVDAPIAPVFYIVHPWRRPTDAQRWTSFRA